MPKKPASLFVVPKRLEYLENTEGVEGIKAVLDFAGSTFQAIKKSLADGSISPLDAIYLVEPLTKLSSMIKGLPTIGKELADDLTDEELQEIMGVLLGYGVVPDELVDAVNDHIKWARDTKALVFKYYIRD